MNGGKQHTGLASTKKVETKEGTTIRAVNNWPAELGANDTNVNEETEVEKETASLTRVKLQNSPE